MTHNNLCSFCTKKVDFYMPPHIEPDSCGNYVVMQPTVEAIPKDQYEARLKADMVVILNEIRVQIEHIETSRRIDEHTALIRTAEQAKKVVLDIIDKYIQGREE